MVFSSSLFVWLFLPLVFLLYFGLRRELRNALLLVVSLFFYAWGETFLVGVLLVSIVANWLFGLWLAREMKRGRGKAVVVWAAVFNIGLLVLFKYSDWLVATASFVLHDWAHLLSSPIPSVGSWIEPRSALSGLLLAPDGSVRLPIGISFFTFQALSYVIDIYRRDVEAERSVLDFGMYKAFFPQLIAGPIVRYRDVHVQIHERRETVSGFAYGVRRFIIGCGKKMLISNVVAASGDQIFALPPADLTAPVAWLGIVCYTIQIYFDFSGYSDMAIGLGHMFGFKFLENFNYPYVARSITDFWRRWHISLSTWFRDYLYIPLGGSRVRPARTYLNLITVFFLCGLWHGASYNFVVWGLFHGALLVVERLGFGRWLAARSAIIAHGYTLFFVMIGWVFFRANDLDHATDYLQVMFGLSPADPRVHPLVHFVDAEVWTAIALAVIGSTPWLPRVVAWWRGLAAAGRGGLQSALEWAGVVALLCVFVDCALKFAAGTYSPFIYFRF
jgi:alginate O-acetyltransferase complex protein AlgI